MVTTKSIFITLFVLFFAIRFFIQRSKKRSKAMIPRDILEKYDKIIVSVKELDVLERSYYEEMEPNPHSTAAIADALYDPMRNVVTVQQFIAVVVYPAYMHLGKKYRLVSTPIHLPKEMIWDYLETKKTITIFINPSDVNDHYFDIKLS